MKKILFVTDDCSTLAWLGENTLFDDYEIHIVRDGLTVLNEGLYKKNCFIILDVMSPPLDGVEICRRLKQENVQIPILILSTKNEEVDRLIALELGADDYLTKPYSVRELLARVKAILRRIHEWGGIEKPIDHLPSDRNSNEYYTGQLLTNGDLTVDSRYYLAYLGDQPLNLTLKEFRLLYFFIKHKGSTLSREALLNHVWEYTYMGDVRVVDVYVRQLRKKIELDPRNPKYIQTVRSLGYEMPVLGNDNPDGKNN